MDMFRGWLYSKHWTPTAAIQQLKEQDKLDQRQGQKDADCWYAGLPNINDRVHARLLELYQFSIEIAAPKFTKDMEWALSLRLLDPCFEVIVEAVDTVQRDSRIYRSLVNLVARDAKIHGNNKKMSKFPWAFRDAVMAKIGRLVSSDPSDDDSEAESASEPGDTSGGSSGEGSDGGARDVTGGRYDDSSDEDSDGWYSDIYADD